MQITTGYTTHKGRNFDIKRAASDFSNKSSCTPAIELIADTGKKIKLVPKVQVIKQINYSKGKINKEYLKARSRKFTDSWYNKVA